MHETIKKMAQAFTKQREQRRRAYAAFTALAILVSVTTTYWLVKPASTMAAEYTCGIEEHVHTDECYADVLICGYGETEEDSEDSEEAPDTEEAPGTEAPETEVPIEEAAPEAPAEETEEPAPVEEESTLEIEEPQETEEPQEEEQAPVEAEAAAEPEESADEEPAAAEDPAEEPVTEAPAEEEAEPAAVSQEPDESEEAASEPEEAAEDSEPAAEADETDEGSEDSDSSESASKKSSGGASKMAVRVSAEPAEADEAEESEDAAPAEDGEHVHTAACYEKVLVCGKEEHVHDETCSEMLEAEELGELICTQPEHTHTEDCWDENGALICTLEEHTHSDSCYKIEQGNLMMVLPAGAEIPEGYEIEYSYIDPDNRFGVAVYTPEGAFPEGAELAVELLTEDSEAYIHTNKVLDEMVARDELRYDQFVALDVHFLLNGEEIQPAEPVYVCINALSLFSEDADPTTLTVHHLAEVHEDAAGEEPVEEPAVEEFVEEPVVEESVEEATVEEAPAEPIEIDGLLVETVADGTEETVGQVEAVENGETYDVATAFEVSNFSIMLMTIQNEIKFTVQHYINIQRVELGTAKDSYTNAVIGEGNLPVIDTRDDLDGDGGILPSGATPNLVNVTVDKSTGKIKMVDSTEKVYKDETYTYSQKLSSTASQADNMTAINKLATNSNYAIKEVWVLKSGKSANSTSRDDWNIYSPTVVKFSNNSTADSNTVVVTDGMVIRLVYDTNTNSHSNAANFYDYNISNGYTESGSGDSAIYTMVTDQKGINSSGNYSNSSKVKLAFGNKNTGSGLADEYFESNGEKQYLNQYNGNGFKGCTFGIASGLDSDGHIVYNSKVVAPNLFNEGGTVTGKKSYSGTLNFTSSGDSFELVSVSETDKIKQLTGLNLFNNPVCGTTTYSQIWTNNFWPMDSATDTPRDIQFGNYKDYAAGNRIYSNSDGSTTGPLPKSDDGKNHNSYFGMNYAVQFDLTADYIGPLDYLFFGDDDMWVFLTDPNGNSQLICDIGGVHSSVGEYVDLWDYIPKDRSDDGTYRLTFFYTERGASGSTCYMRFTLPSVSSVSTDRISGALEISKKVVGATTDAEFTFNLDLSSSDTYTAVYSDGSTQTVSGKNNVITLAHGETITIPDLPVGATYSITETAVDGYHTTYQVNSGEVTVGNTASGLIEQGTTSVAYVNTTGPMLPSTGGPGTNFITTLGTVMMLGAGVLLLDQRRRKGGPSAT